MVGDDLTVLRKQAPFTLHTLRLTCDLLERLLAGELTEEQIEAFRSHSRAALRSLRSTNQLVASVAEARANRIAEGGTANGSHRRTARVG